MTSKTIPRRPKSSKGYCPYPAGHQTLGTRRAYDRALKADEHLLALLNKIRNAGGTPDANLIEAAGCIRRVLGYLDHAAGEAEFGPRKGDATH